MLCIKCNSSNFMSRRRCFKCTAGQPTLEEISKYNAEMEKSNKSNNSNSGRGSGRGRGR